MPQWAGDHLLACGFFRETVQETVLRPAAHDIQPVKCFSGIAFEFLQCLSVGQCQRPVGTAEVIFRLKRSLSKHQIKGEFHAGRREKALIVGVHGLVKCALLRFFLDLRPVFLRAEFRAKPVHEPHAHDVLLIAVVTDAAFIGPVCSFARLIRKRLSGLHAQ